MTPQRPFCPNPRLVGDPVDTLTGANTDIDLDFALEGPLPLRWRRFYDSGRHKEALSLGWGHTHGFDHALAYDMEGIAHVGPDGRHTHFPYLEKPGDEAAAGIATLKRGPDQLFFLRIGDAPTLSFRMIDPSRPAPLAGMELGRHRIDFQYRDGRLDAIRDSRQRVMRFAWSKEKAPRECRIDLFDPMGKLMGLLLIYRFDGSGNLAEAVDHYGHKFSFGWDDAGRMTRKTDRRGYSFLFAYDRDGRCVRSAGVDGVQSVDLDFQPREFRTRVTQADGGGWDYHFDPIGSLTHVVDPFGYAWIYQSDAEGRIEREIDPLGNEKAWVYKADGRLAGTRDALGRFAPPGEDPTPGFQGPILMPAIAGIQPFRFADRGFLTARPYSGRTPVEWEFGGMYAYSHIRPPTAAELAGLDIPAGLSGHLYVIREDQAAQYPPPETPPFQLGPRPYPPSKPKRDILGNLARLEFPDGSHCVWNKDPVGNTLRHIDRDGRHQRYTYTSWNHPAKGWTPDGIDAAYAFTPREQIARLERGPRTRIEYEYDLRGRLAALRRGGTAFSFAYDAADRLESKFDAAGKELFSIAYGPAGWVAKVALASGEVLTYVPDEEGRLLSCKSAAGEVEWAYGLLGRKLADKRNGKGVEHEYTSLEWKSTMVFGRFRICREVVPGGEIITDPAGGCHKVRRLPHGILVKEFACGAKAVSQYDLSGACLAKASASAGAFQPPWFREYLYSSEGRLLETRDSRWGTSSYGYDELGRLARAKTGLDSGAAFVYDEDGNLTSQPGMRWADHGPGNLLRATADEEFGYDAAGNMEERRSLDGTTRYRHDELGRLAAADLPGGKWEAGYDALGRLAFTVWKGARHELYWDGERLAAELFPDSRFRVYVYPDPSARVPLVFIDYTSPEADPASGSVYAPLVDQVGAPVTVMDANWVAVWEAEVSPYGGVHRRDRTDFVYNPAFPGHYRIAELGLHYNRHRYYDPGLGRYLEPDPLDIVGGANLYAYTPHPLDEVDLEGLACPPKPILTENIDMTMRQKALKLAAALEQRALDTIVSEGPPLRTLHADITFAVTVVRKKDGEREIWVTQSSSPHKYKDKNGTVLGPHIAVRDLVPQEYFRTSPRRDRGASKRQNHAEQRALRAADCDDNVVGVETIAPTRPPCNCRPNGCTQQISDRNDPDMTSVVQPEGRPLTGRELPPEDWAKNLVWVRVWRGPAGTQPTGGRLLLRWPGGTQPTGGGR